MKEYIKNTLVEFHKSCTTDKYGQVHKSNYTLSIFGNNRDKVEEYCKNNPNILKFSTYGGKFGTYKAFTIQDEGIRKVCQDTLSTNENYLRNVNSWY